MKILGIVSIVYFYRGMNFMTRRDVKVVDWCQTNGECQHLSLIKEMFRQTVIVIEIENPRYEMFDVLMVVLYLS